jgi:hypothetical protein
MLTSFSRPNHRPLPHHSTDHLDGLSLRLSRLCPVLRLPDSERHIPGPGDPPRPRGIRVRARHLHADARHPGGDAAAGHGSCHVGLGIGPLPGRDDG